LFCDSHTLHPTTKKIQNFDAPIGDTNNNHRALDCLSKARVDKPAPLDTEKILRFANP